MASKVDTSAEHAADDEPNADPVDAGAAGAGAGGDPSSGPGERVSAAPAPLWGDRRLGLATAAGVAALWGLVAGIWTPRGPLTTSEVLAAMLLGVVVGVAAGLASRSRWAMLVAPLGFVAAFELTRIGTDGPTVDAPAFSEYGTYAFVVGRSFHGLVALTPMVLGAAVGAGVARRLATNRGDGGSATASTWARRGGAWARRGGVALVGLALVALAVARPARTDPIVDASGEPVEGSIAELSAVSAGGTDLGLMIRGTDVDNPVVLFLAGGPGGSERGAMRNHLEALEDSFTVATWDQRGTGTSYPALDPTDTLTLQGQVDDAIEATEHLIDRFDQERIYLLGQSWGSTLGVLAVQQAPELYEAFIGTGQMISQLETDRIFYEDTLAWARENGDTALVDELEAIGPPPYDQMLDYETALANEHDVHPYDHSPNSEGEAGFSESFIVPEYALVDQVHLLGAFMDTFSVLYPQLQDIDFRASATEFAVPMFFVQGANEAGGRAELFEEWYPTIDAPVKELDVLETSGHRPLFEQPDEFVTFMTDTVLEPVNGR